MATLPDRASSFIAAAICIQHTHHYVIRNSGAVRSSRHTAPPAPRTSQTSSSKLAGNLTRARSEDVQEMQRAEYRHLPPPSRVRQDEAAAARSKLCTS
eukprot:COSAG01_NODE_2124_length_8370_cov_2.754110_6_plen_98_part_00